MNGVPMKLDYSKTLNEQLDTFEYYKNRYCSYELELMEDRKEIERLNNIIDEIKNMCKEEYYKKNTTDIDSIGLSNNIWVMIYMKINELKGE